KLHRLPSPRGVALQSDNIAILSCGSGDGDSLRCGGSSTLASCPFQGFTCVGSTPMESRGVGPPIS
ncbi:hypothetical protein EE612_028718, partial [Oryza sativa]